MRKWIVAALVLTVATGARGSGDGPTDLASRTSTLSGSVNHAEGA